MPLRVRHGSPVGGRTVMMATLPVAPPGPAAQVNPARLMRDITDPRAVVMSLGDSRCSEQVISTIIDPLSRAGPVFVVHLGEFIGGDAPEMRSIKKHWACFNRQLGTLRLHRAGRPGNHAVLGGRRAVWTCLARKLSAACGETPRCAEGNTTPARDGPAAPNRVTRRATSSGIGSTSLRRVVSCS